MDIVYLPNTIAFMRLQNINTVILLGLFSLLGVLLIQVFWVRNTISIENRKLELQRHQDSVAIVQFNEKVHLALTKTAEVFHKRINDPSDLYGFVQQKNFNAFKVHINENIHPLYLEELLKREFYEHGVKETFQYAIYDCYGDSLVMGNLLFFAAGSYHVKKDRDFYEDMREFEETEFDGHYFIVHFPTKINVALNEYAHDSSYWLPLLAVIGFILLSFGYALTIIFKQKRLSEVKTDFINNMTHELKTPISTIGLSSETLLREDFSNDPERLQRYAGIIYKENKRLENQVERVLNIAKMDKEQIKLNYSLFDLHDLIQEAADVFEFNQSETGGRMLLDLEATQTLIKADEVHIGNVIHNLIDNAIKYCDKEPEVKIATKNLGSAIQLVIQDNGIGIKKEDIKMIFDKFFRVSTGNVHNVKGFGLGLYYVKLIVESHGGKISVKSQIGQGTSFIIVLPINKNE
jgi:two-component system, OmpR family, phosphate regulon sensor histidine kinase PhoR